MRARYFTGELTFKATVNAGSLIHLKVSNDLCCSQKRPEKETLRILPAASISESMPFLLPHIGDSIAEVSSTVSLHLTIHY